MNIMDLLDPHSIYFSSLKELHNNNATKFFENLVIESKVDVEYNKAINKEIDNFELLAKDARKKENSAAFLRGFLIFLTISCFVAAVIFFIFFAQDIVLKKEISILVGIGLIILAIVFIFINVKKVTPLYRKRKEKRINIEFQRDDAIQKALIGLAGLNELFDWNMAATIVSQTAPLIQMDKNFDMEKYEYLHEKYGFDNDKETFRSVVHVQSGSIVGNPFLVEKVKIQTMVDEIYHGYKTISWTERVRDSKGHYRTVTRTQTLHATVTAPKPCYHYETWLIYGNDAAESLNFTRYPSSASGKTEKQIDKMVDKGEKKLDDLVEKTLMDDIPGVYTKMGNVEFDVLFGAQDRDNETQFRLLFTPLAQSSILKIIKSDEPYGDDFYFAKRKHLNYIYAKHMNNLNFGIDPSYFEGYDLEEMKAKFVDYNNKYFSSLFFALAPLLSIPLYQQQKPLEYIYKRNYNANITTIEHEVMANKFDSRLLRHERSSTELILKTSLINKDKDSDHVNIIAYSFEGIPQVTYKNVWGGDGRMHSVPVHWVHYEQVVQTNPMAISKHNLTRKQYNDKKNSDGIASILSTYTKERSMVYQRGLLSLLLASTFASSDMDRLKNVLDK